MDSFLSNNICLNIRKLSEHYYPPTLNSYGAIGLDVYSPINIVLMPFVATPIFLNFAVSLPPRYYCRLEAQPTLGVRGIISLQTFVDADYADNISMLLMNASNTPYTVHRGTKVGLLCTHKYVMPSVFDISVYTD